MTQSTTNITALVPNDAPYGDLWDIGSAIFNASIQALRENQITRGELLFMLSNIYSELSQRAFRHYMGQTYGNYEEVSF